ncbi:MAG: hypothetical protein M1829_005238 [Trizodia sp. TS-e1964]|nr:MAG: hypothetical protein M1829_005238 [Trizodia sp. TS-e1964]
MALRTAFLSDYISKAHDHPVSVFNASTTHPQPMLRSDRPNKILLYPDSFNPPHLGHFELLRHGFFKSGADMNLIAAIVLPLNDSSLERKVNNDDDPLIFTQEERIRLWTGDTPQHQWFWAFDSCISKWAAFRRLLSSLIQRDRFDFDWVALVGPDHIHVDVVQQGIWGCNKMLVSDCGRKASFLSKENKLIKLTEFTDWVEIKPDVPQLLKDARETVHAEFNCLIKESPKAARLLLEDDPRYRERQTILRYCAAFNAGQGLHTCRRESCLLNIVRFIKAQAAPLKMSSSLVREVVRLHPPELLRKLLKNLVLYPDILMEMLAAKKKKQRLEA